MPLFVQQQEPKSQILVSKHTQPGRSPRARRAMRTCAEINAISCSTAVPAGSSRPELQMNEAADALCNDAHSFIGVIARF